MDDLDRLLQRLVQRIRAEYAEYMNRPFEVSELYQNIVPYRHNRRELGIETNQDYELALLRLLAGERGYLLGDASMQEAVKRELASPNPNTALFREFAAARVSLSPEASRRVEQMSSGAQPDDVRTVTAAPPPPPRPAAPPPPRPAAPPPPRPAPAPSAAQPGLSSAMASPPPPPRAPTPPPAEYYATPPASERVTGSVGRGGGASSATAAGVCRYCGGSLPQGRRVTFCPHCGQNLAVQRCPACSTELELGWKFCTTCGRAVASA